MRFKITILSLLLVLCIPGLALAEGFIFSVNHNGTLQNASFGLNLGKLQPYMGLDIMGVSAEATVSETESWGHNDDVWVDQSTYTAKGSALLIIPHFGLKYCVTQEGSVRPYVKGGFFKCMPQISVEGSETSVHTHYDNGTLVDQYEDTDELSDEVEAEEIAKDVLDFWGMNIGFGAECFLDDNFSIGGEYGLRMLFISAEYSEGEDDSGTPDEWEEQWSGEVSGAFKVSYATISVNYYF